MSPNEAPIQPVSPTSMEIGDLTKRLTAIEKLYSDLRYDHAANKPVEAIVKYLLYFWLTISVILGVFGLKQLSDIDAKVADKVAQLLPKSSKRYAEFEALIEKTKELNDKFDDLFGDYTKRVDALRFTDVATNDFDLEGKIAKVVSEADEPANRDDIAWRTKAIATIQLFSESLSKRAFPPDLVFNVAQTCRQLDQTHLLLTLAKAANEKDPSPANRALLLAAMTATSGGDERKAHLRDLLSQIPSLDFDKNPEIVLSEAWNASETSRSYTELIASIRRLQSVSGGRPIPSYAFLIAAQAELRQSRPGSVTRAKEDLKTALDTFRQESTMSTWAERFPVEYLKLTEVVHARDSEQLESLANVLKAANSEAD